MWDVFHASGCRSPRVHGSQVNAIRHNGNGAECSSLVCVALPLSIHYFILCEGIFKL